MGAFHLYLYLANRSVLYITVFPAFAGMVGGRTDKEAHILYKFQAYYFLPLSFQLDFLKITYVILAASSGSGLLSGACDLCSHRGLCV